MLRKIRIAIAIIIFVPLTLLFLDFSETMHKWVGFLAKIQFIPALLAFNIAIIVGLVLLTIVFGRIYCSTICPLGVLQDIISWFAKRRVKRKKGRIFSFSPPMNTLRYAVLAVYAISIVVGIHLVVSLLDPYGYYGRIVSNIISPIYIGGNNILGLIAEHYNSYAFYTVEIWQRSADVLVIALSTLVLLVVLAWTSGRIFCNSLCPVGTFLGLISRFSILKPYINLDKCNDCGVCAKQCKSSCIDAENHTIDYSRCVACMDCLESCKEDALSFTNKTNKRVEKAEEGKPDISRRSFFSAVSLLGISTVVYSQKKKLDGGMAVLQDKQIPKRSTPIYPPGSQSVKNFTQNCTACQLCITKCPNNVLRPSERFENYMQPEMSFENGYCRTECTNCSEVCPTSAIKPIKEGEKSAIQIGHAVWIRRNCIVHADEVQCDNCAAHCPPGAITMVAIDKDDPNSLKVPTIDTERCTGCGACEYLCPSNPFSAIHVVGHLRHKLI